MKSPAALKYVSATEHIKVLRKAGTDARLRHMLHDEIQVFYHAALTAYVAAWNAYINDLVSEFYSLISDPSNQKFDAVYIIAQQAAENALARFNTPNWENTRDILRRYTGYDPINDWGSSQRSMNLEQVRERLTEILKVRHSFAPGSNIPAYVWTQSPSGKVRLTSKVIQDADAFFKRLVKVTDKGIKTHIESTYNLTNIW